MAIAALVAWILTASGGFYMLAKWLSGGGHRHNTATRFPPALIFGHMLLAAAGLVLWIIYLLIDNDAVGWAALIVLVPVALLGFTMLARWIPSYRNSMATATASTAGGPAGSGDAAPERSFPVAVVAAHGLLAVVTVVLVLLAMVAIGS